MGRYGEIWGDMGRYGEIWGDTGRYGELPRAACEGHARRRRVRERPRAPAEADGADAAAATPLLQPLRHAAHVLNHRSHRRRDRAYPLDLREGSREGSQKAPRTCSSGGAATAPYTACLRRCRRGGSRPSEGRGAAWREGYRHSDTAISEVQPNVRHRRGAVGCLPHLGSWPARRRTPRRRTCHRWRVAAPPPAPPPPKSPEAQRCQEGPRPKPPGGRAGRSTPEGRLARVNEEH